MVGVRFWTQESRTFTGPKGYPHGFSTSSTPLFLNSFKLEIAVIQVGADNSYGHPTPQTLERLQKAGARSFATTSTVT